MVEQNTKNIIKSKTAIIGTIMAVLQAVELQSGAITLLLGDKAQAAMGILTAVSMVILRSISTGGVHVK